MPKPGMALNCEAADNVKFFPAAVFTIASPRCSEFFSAEAASRNTSSWEYPAAAIISVTEGLTHGQRAGLSQQHGVNFMCPLQGIALRMRMPCSAPLPVPTIIAVGVASPNAQGRQSPAPATKLRKAYVRCGDGPAKNQTRKVTTAIPMTIGTK